MRTFRAAILRHINNPLFTLIVRPENELQVGQVFVKVKCATICGAQIGEITGAKGNDPYLPHLLGHEGAGIVQEVGPGVRYVSPGDHVVMHWRKGQGIDAVPAKYTTFFSTDGEREVVGAGPVSTFSEYAIVSENRLTKIPNDVPFDIASLFGCAVTTGFGIINNEAKLKIGQDILVIGAGGVGLNVIYAANIAGANEVIVCDNSKDKLVFSTGFGITGVSKDLFDLEFNNTFFDVVVDCIGISSLIDRGLRRVKPGGKLVLVGQTVKDRCVSFSDFSQHYKGKTILDSQGGLTNPTEDIPRYIQMYDNGKLKKLYNIITDRYPLSEINTAFDRVKAGKVMGRCLITMEG